ncbi:uncharacterized protein LOC120869930 isoform X2 [Oryx dammah]|uniref:uncharacterized protein LOC120869930 isoform X2 n=1 Tax=Oryx dammah TaxID=59534 RepID=UPI001A9B372F|nr:uncharacterized protein LOC120869930 isoform X2 [Oryx dammah]
MCLGDGSSVSPSCSGEKSHADCVLIYKSETEGERDHAPDTDFLGLPTKMLTVKRLGGSHACCRSGQLEKMAFVHCTEEVEKCFLEESSGEQDSKSGKNQAKEQAWSLPGLQETAAATGERTAAPAERSSQKNLPSSEEETINKLDEKQAEKTPASLAQRSSATF